MTEWQDNHLHDPAKYGGIHPMGSGPYGGTIWDATTGTFIEWRDNYLHDPAKYGGIHPMGAGPYGGTVWEITL